MGTVKILLSGDPQGKLDALFKRVAAVNKSSGPFDVLLCVGAFFSPSGGRQHTCAIMWYEVWKQLGVIAVCAMGVTPA